MSLLLHIIAKGIFFSVLTVIVLTLLTWLTRTKSDQSRPPSSGEWPEDKGTHVDRISAQRPYSSSRRDLKDDQERRRA
jgi:hypothetical protein